MRLAIVRDKVEYENEYSCYDQSSIEQKGWKKRDTGLFLKHISLQLSLLELW
jgi:hypothetical protein